MKITPEEIRHVASLARLELNDEMVDKMVSQMGEVLAYMDQLNELDTGGAAPMSHAVDMTNAFREDIPGEHTDRDAILSNAPQAEDGAFIVPRVVGRTAE